MKKVVFSLLITLLPSFLYAGIDEGKAKSAVCASCHLQDGNSAIPQYPKLAGQHASYLEKQLLDYQNTNGSRDNAIMKGMVAQLSAEDIKDLAAYFESQEIKLGSANPDLVALGEKIYRGGIIEKGVPACSGCHGPSGLGNGAAKFPRLSGQHAAYTVDQLNLFKDGKRKNDINGMMQSIAKNLSESEMTAVASFIQGLKP